MTKKPFLTQIFSQNEMRPEQIEQVVNNFKKVTFQKHDYLLQEGAIADKYWFVETGVMRAFVVNQAGEEVTTEFYTHGQMALQAPSFLGRMPSQENIQALSEVTAWEMSFTRFQPLFQNIIPYQTSARGHLVNDYFALKERNVSMIVDSAQTRYLKLLKNHPEVIQFAPLKHIATYLGITDTSLSRIRRKLAEEGIS
ncbi:MAG: Crp/Fnr family transcriptional regulator [Saprospiraceae bacterium]